FFFQAEDGIRDKLVTGVQTCALPILLDQAVAVSSLLLDREREMRPQRPGRAAHPGSGAGRAPSPGRRAARACGSRDQARRPTRRSEERRVGKEWKSGSGEEP